MMTASDFRALGKKMLQRVRFLQALTAFPTVVYFMWMCNLYWSHPYDIWYWFTLHMVGGFMAAGILFIVSSQRWNPVLDLQTVYLEAGKSFLATLLWLYTDPFGYNVKRTILSTTVLVVFYYIPLVYAIRAREPENAWQRLGEGDKKIAAHTAVAETSPLLQD